MSCAEECPLDIYMLKCLRLLPQNASVFGDRVCKEATEVKCGHRGDP